MTEKAFKTYRRSQRKASTPKHKNYMLVSELGGGLGEKKRDPDFVGTWTGTNSGRGEEDVNRKRWRRKVKRCPEKVRGKNRGFINIINTNRKSVEVEPDKEPYKAGRSHLNG